MSSRRKSLTDICHSNLKKALTSSTDNNNNNISSSIDIDKNDCVCGNTFREKSYLAANFDTFISGSPGARSSIPCIKLPVLLKVLAYTFLLYSIWFMAIADANDLSATMGDAVSDMSNTSLNASYIRASAGSDIDLFFHHSKASALFNHSGNPIHRNSNYTIISAKNNLDHGRNTTIHIVFSTDSTMIPLTVVSIISIIHKADDPRNLFFHLMLIDSKWTADFVDDVKVALGNAISLEVATWDPLPSAIRNMKIRKRERQDLAAPANYARFYVSQVFPSLRRFIYLDNDVMAQRSLSQLWDVDLGTSKVGMVHDCGSWFQNHVVKLQNYNISHPVIKRIFGPELSNHHCHPNAGVMLVNERLRRKYKDLLEVEKLLALNQKEFLYKLGSQPLVVLTNWNHYLPIDNKWNVRTTSFKYRTHVSDEEPGIFHFNGNSRKAFMVRILFSAYNISSIANATHVVLRLVDRLNTSHTIVISNVVVEESVEDSHDHFEINNTTGSMALNTTSMSLHAKDLHHRDMHPVGQHHNGSDPNNIKSHVHHHLKKHLPNRMTEDAREELVREKYWTKIISKVFLKSDSNFSAYVMEMLQRHIAFYQSMNIQLRYPKGEKMQSNHHHQPHQEDKHSHAAEYISKVMADKTLAMNNALLLKHHREKVEIKRKQSNDSKH